MGLLKTLFIIFILSFPIAEVGRVQFPNGVAFTINDLVLLILAIAWLGYNFLSRKKISKNSLTKPILIFIVIALISLIVNIPRLSSMNLLVSFSYLVRWVMYVSIFFIVQDFDKKFKHKISYLMLFSGALIVIAGYIQYFFYPSLSNLFYLGWDSHLYRMFSTFLDPNFAGTFFVLLFIFILGIIYNLLNREQYLKVAILGILEISTLIAVFLTYSRSAFIMLLLSIATFLFLLGKRKLIFASITILFLMVFLAPKSFQTEGTNMFRTFSSQQRIESSQVAIKIFQKSPVLGVGFNAYRYAQNKLGLNNEIWQTTHSGAGTDNSFLFVLATTGIIGLFAYLYLLAGMFKISRNNIKKNIFAVVFISSLVGLIFNSFFINSLFYVFIMEWVWIEASLIENK